MKITLAAHWKISLPQASDEALDVTLLIQLLSCIQTEGSIAAAGRALALSYRHAWGILRDAEALFGGKLIVKQPGRGTHLSELSHILIQADKRFSARLAPTLDSLASELEAELRRVLPSESKAVRLYASHGFAVETLLALMRTKNVMAEIRYRNSSEALAALSNGECDLAGFHVPRGEFQTPVLQQYRKWLAPDYTLIQVATRTQGLFLAHGNPRGVKGLTDLTRKSIRFVNRQAGSGTRMLLEMMLQKKRLHAQAINGFETAEFTHAAVAAYIASGMADAGFGIETAARRFDLHFIPLATERYFFATKAASLHLDGVQQIIALLRSEEFRAAAAGLEGYDAVKAGSVLALQEAFSASAISD